MQKSDLKPGMKVVLNNEREYYIIDDKYMVDLHQNHAYLTLDNYSEDLSTSMGKTSWGVKKLYKYDIVTKEWVEFPQIVQEKMTISLKYTIKVTKNGNKTTVLLPDGTQATTTCLPEDSYDEEKGVSIAYLKARMKSDAKVLKELTK